MNNLAEIESAIESLPPSQVEKLAVWLEDLMSQHRQKAIEAWLDTAQGAAIPGITTEQVMRLTRGDEWPEA